MRSLPENYGLVLQGLKEKIRAARQKAILHVNKELIQVYWEIGAVINEQQKAEGWGTKVVERLSTELKSEFPDFKGLSTRNLKYMSLFARRFPEFGQQAAAQMQHTENQSNEIRQQVAAQLPWGHLQVLLDKVEHDELMDFYIRRCIDNGWSRNILVEQIQSQLHLRQGAAITNFKERLPAPQSDLAQQTLKNPYVFDFLALGEEMKELELERALIAHLKDFMLELGKGFAYVGRQKNLIVEGDDFFLDLLFYNYNLHRFVVFELKVGEFKPDYAGKLNFYVNAIDQQIKGPDDKPTIGVLLCKTPNETVIRYSLKGIESPIGVADYQLAKALPKQLKAEMPTMEELEAEIDKEYEELKSPTQKRLESLKENISALKQPELRTPVSYEILCKIYEEGIKPLFRQLLSRMEDFHSEFMSHNYFWGGPVNILGLSDLDKHWKDEGYLKNTRELYFSYRLLGFKRAGVEAFDVGIQLNYLIHNPYWYGFSLTNVNHNQPFIKKMYSDNITPLDVTDICDSVCNQVITEIEVRLPFIDSSKSV